MFLSLFYWAFQRFLQNTKKNVFSSRKIRYFLNFKCKPAHNFVFRHFCCHLCIKCKIYYKGVLENHVYSTSNIIKCYKNICTSFHTRQWWLTTASLFCLFYLLQRWLIIDYKVKGQPKTDHSHIIVSCFQYLGIMKCPVAIPLFSLSHVCRYGKTIYFFFFLIKGSIAQFISFLPFSC